MDALAKLLHEIYKDAYLQGREDGLEGIHIEPQLVLDKYMSENGFFIKMSEMGFLSAPVGCSKANDVH
ncbi:hypothetical protein MN202_10050 [Rheinheimera muenzenbergensis]|uniref:Uncharacterized protein n=1 Tax=Rheinheimera muenzenbergensis TaxID=1193628 RepID=A0ABU8C6N3_9GAMM